MPAHTERRKLAAIMFTDMVGYSKLTQRNEALALELLEEHQRTLRAILPEHQGNEIKTTGDGFLVEFGSALAAVRCAIEIQDRLSERNQAATADRQVRIRIGIHVGDVVWRENDVFGDGVNIAARIEPLAEPGGICISNAVYEQVRNKIEHALIQFGTPELKNIQLPVVVYKVSLEIPGSSTRASLPDPAGTVAERKTKHRARRALAVAVVLVLGLNVWFFLKFGMGASRSVKVPGAPGSLPRQPGQKSIAVLPFANMSANKEADEWLSDGLTEHLITVLSQVGGLRVLPRTSAFAYKDKYDELRKAATQLNVSHALAGGVQKAGNRLRITAQLIDLASNSHLWATNYDRTMDDIFAVQSEVAAQVVESLKGRLLANEREQLTRPPTFNVEAYELGLKGYYHLNRWTKADWNQAVDYFMQSVAKDTNYAVAYIGIADCHAIASTWLLAPKLAYAKARTAILKALELDPASYSAHSTLGDIKMWHDWDWPGAEAEFIRAEDLGAKPSTQVGHSFWLCAQGRLEEGVREFEKGAKLDPKSPGAHRLLAFSHYLNRDYDRAIEAARQAIAIDSQDAEGYSILAMAYGAKESFAEALAQVQEAKRLTGDEVYEFSIAYFTARLGRKQEALKGLEQTRTALSAQERYVAPYYSAIVHIGLGDKDQAYAWLERAVEQRDDFLIMLNVEPIFDPLRGDPRFQALVEKVGLAKGARARP